MKPVTIDSEVELTRRGQGVIHRGALTADERQR